MSVLSGKEAADFVEWLHGAAQVLPPKMTLLEAKEIFLRRCQEQKEIENEKKKTVN